MAPDVAHKDLGADAGNFEERCLQVIVRFSIELRWQLFSSAVVLAAVDIDGGSPWRWVLAWMVVLGVVREARLAAIVRMGAGHEVPIQTRLRRLALWTWGLGTAYGVPAFLLMPRADTAHAAVATMILLTLSAGAVSTTYSVMRAFIAYAVPISVPTALYWCWSGGWFGWSVGALVLMFLGVQIRFARQNRQMFEESYRIRLVNDELLRELSSERARLAQARDLAVQADYTKSRFLASASHDLRQPLHGLALNSGALSRMPIVGEGKEIVAEISAGIEALRQMLDALLDVSQLDGGAVAPNLQPVYLSRLLDGVCKTFRPAAEAKGLRLVCDCAETLTVMSSPKELRRVVSNLLDNAIKFTVEGTVSMSAKDDGDRVRLIVSDTGGGIDPSDQQRIFDDLEQLRNPHRDRSLGHGLGLGIVRRLTRLLGIDLSVESRLGAGATFRLRLPKADGNMPVISDSNPMYPSLVARRVLVLEDDQAVRMAYRHALVSLGCSVAVAGTIDEAVRALAVQVPEIVLADYRLPGPLDGLQAIGLLRERVPGLPAIVISADTSSELRDAAAALSVPVMRKPTTDAGLAATINGELFRRESQWREPTPDVH